MDNKNNHNHHGGGNGLLVGAIIGSVATLLFTTKKGRKLVREFADKSIEKIAELENSLDQVPEEADEIEGNDYVRLEPKAVSDSAQKVILEKEQEEEEKPRVIKKAPIPVPNPKKPVVKRFFRKLKKN